MDEQKRALLLRDIEYFSKKLEENPESKVFMPLSIAYLKLGKYDEAMEICLNGLDKNPDYFSPKTILAEAYIGKGMVNEAKGLLLEVATVLKDNYKANKLLGEIYRAEGKLDKAIYYYRNALQAAPEDFELRQLLEELATKTDATPQSVEKIEEQEDLKETAETEEIDEKGLDVATLTEHLADEVLDDISKTQEDDLKTGDAEPSEQEEYEKEEILEVVIPVEEDLRDSEKSESNTFEEFETSTDINEMLDRTFSEENKTEEMLADEVSVSLEELKEADQEDETIFEGEEEIIEESFEEFNKKFSEKLNKLEDIGAEDVNEETEISRKLEAVKSEENIKNAQAVKKLEEWLENIEKIKMNKNV